MIKRTTSYRRREVSTSTTVQPRGNIYDRIAEARERRATSQPSNTSVSGPEGSNRTASRATPSMPIDLDPETTRSYFAVKLEPANDNRPRSVSARLSLIIGRLFGLYSKAPPR